MQENCIIVGLLTVLDSVNPAVCNLDNFVEGNEWCLQRRQFYQKFDRSLEIFLQFGNLLPTAWQASQLIRIRPILITFEYRQRHT